MNPDKKFFLGGGPCLPQNEACKKMGGGAPAPQAPPRTAYDSNVKIGMCKYIINGLHRDADRKPSWLARILSESAIFKLTTSYAMLRKIICRKFFVCMLYLKSVLNLGYSYHWWHFDQIIVTIRFYFYDSFDAKM